jgi:molybdopterin converting factor small subunit
MKNSALNKGISTPLGILIIVLVALFAGGILAWQYFGALKEKAKASEEKIEKSKEPIEVVKDETANWKTYKNEEYGFEIKYPPNFFYQVINSRKIEFIEAIWKGRVGNYPLIGIEIIENSLSLDDWFKKQQKKAIEEGFEFFEEGCEMHCISKEAKEIKIGEGIKALKYKERGVSGENDVVVVKKEKSNWIIKIYKHSSGWGEKGIYSEKGVIPDEIFNKILSTLRFVEK